VEQWRRFAAGHTPSDDNQPKTSFREKTIGQNVAMTPRYKGNLL